MSFFFFFFFFWELSVKVKVGIVHNALIIQILHSNPMVIAESPESINFAQRFSEASTMDAFKECTLFVKNLN